MLKRISIRLTFWLMIAVTALAAILFAHCLALDIVQIGDPPRPDLILRAGRLHPILMMLLCVGLVLAISVSFLAVDYERAIGILVAIVLLAAVVAVAWRILTDRGASLSDSSIAAPVACSRPAAVFCGGFVAAAGHTEDVKGAHRSSAPQTSMLPPNRSRKTATIETALFSSTRQTASLISVVRRS
jgi:hypothetical protein